MGNGEAIFSSGTGCEKLDGHNQLITDVTEVREAVLNFAFMS
jgi:hypothetical protein